MNRIVFYGCELFAGQMMQGADYVTLRPVNSICLINGLIWRDATEIHHAFRLADKKTGRVLKDTLEIHTIELGRHTLKESALKTASDLDCWLFWLLYAHEYEPDQLLKLFPQQAIRKATISIIKIAEITEDKAMYDSREKAIQDREWQLSSAFREGKL